MLLAISGCHGGSNCIDADDFGFTTVNISSRYNENDVVGSEANQIAPWVDKNLRLSGKVIVVMIRNWHYGEDFNSKKTLSAWCPWWGIEGSDHYLTPYCRRLRECKFLNDEPCYSMPPHTIYAKDAAAFPAITNAPCLMKKGMGLYANIQPRNGPDPNASLESKRMPPNVNIHVGEPTFDPDSEIGFHFFDFSGKGIMRKAGGFRYNFDGKHDLTSTRLKYVDGRLYFKILDSHYNDNNGQYIAVFKSGLHEPAGDLFSQIKRIVREKLFGSGDPNDATLKANGIVRTIFQNIITTPGYIYAVRAALILYVALMGLMFVMGTIQLTHSELLSRVIKITVITALLTPEISWDFFNQYIFIWMYDGSAFLVRILEDAANTGPGDSSILTFLTTPQIMAKLSSLLFSTYTGWLFITIYFIMLIFISIVLFDATVLYLTAQVMIGLLITLAPIFIAFYLFESTRSFFENWLKQMIGYAVQTVIVTAGILFMSMIIRNQVYNTLGFRVCLHQFPDMNIPSGGLSSLTGGGGDGPDEPISSIFAWWFPKISSDSDGVGLHRILIPKAHFVRPGSELGFGVSPEEPEPEEGVFCPAYECVGMRYPDLPFLDPNNPFEARQMRLLRSDQIIDFGGLFIIVICCYLLHHFNKTTISISKFLTGTTANYTDTGAVVDKVHDQSIGAIGRKLDKKSGFLKLRSNIRNKIKATWQKKVLDNVKKGASEKHANRLRRQALREAGFIGSKRDFGIGKYGASGDLLKKVETKYGIKQSEALKYKFNMSNHADNLQKHSGMSASAAKKITEGLHGGSAKDFDKLMAKHHFKKKLSELNQKELDELAALKKNGDVQAMLKDKRRADLFQDAYVDAYTEMANEGSGTLTESQKREHAIKSRRMKNKALGQELKNYFSGGLLGNEYDEILTSREAGEIKYKDLHRRTQNEIIADQDAIIEGKLSREELDKMTVAYGKDIQRPDFLAEQRAAGEDMSDFDRVVRENIEHDVHQQLKDSPFMYGDTYVREKMSDDDFDQMIAGLEHAGAEILESDGFLRQEEFYEDNEAALEELHNREEMIKDAVQSEIDRLKDIKYGADSGDGKGMSAMDKFKSKKG